MNPDTRGQFPAPLSTPVPGYDWPADDPDRRPSPDPAEDWLDAYHAATQADLARRFRCATDEERPA